MGSSEESQIPEISDTDGEVSTVVFARKEDAFSR